MNVPFTVDIDGFKIMNFSKDFEIEMEQKGIKNPFWQNISKNSNEIVERRPTRAEKDKYIKMRDEYVARRCFKEIGYESFLNHTKPNNSYNIGTDDISYMRRQEEFVPCKSADRQCSFDCPKFAECALNNARGLD